MSLIVEDGSGLSNAESFTSVADASAYHAARGNTTWATITTTEMEQALRRATDYMQQAYRSRWAGYRFTITQALDWPRSSVPIPDAINSFLAYSMLATNVVPTEVKNACAEMAWKAASGELYADQSQQVLSEAIGPISVTYDRTSPQKIRYSAIDAMLKPYLNAGGANVSLVRA